MSARTVKTHGGGEGKPAGFEAANYVKPPVFAGVTHDMTIAQEEIFGPVLSVITQVYGHHLERARTIANRILPGRVMTNEMVDDPTSPFGGFKMSGFEREFGIHGLQASLETRTVYAN